MLQSFSLEPENMAASELKQAHVWLTCDDRNGDSGRGIENNVQYGETHASSASSTTKILIFGKDPEWITNIFTCLACAQT